ncbi:hypothetical protein OKA04_23490 [Luteolibacter flavescens]|uniref:Uncharacterized protein n=1 Tax=Luteolibacter flavescens TaxID=1859460 RepID=A0ABT3FWV1_9BACT|nr:hypothetical protein [Luteolibacter flavescens]MCW1887721.1 hypothetical protein [Luteolibacter flavescens]
MASGNDKDLKIGITADTSGAEAAKRALDDLKETAGKSGKETADATRSVTDALKEVEEAAKDAGKAVDALADTEKKGAEESTRALEEKLDVTEAVAKAERALMEIESQQAQVRELRANANKKDADSLRMLTDQLNASEAAIRSNIDLARRNPTQGGLNALLGAEDIAVGNRGDLQKVINGLSESNINPMAMPLEVMNRVQEGAEATNKAAEAVENLAGAQKELAHVSADAADELAAYNLAFDDARVGGASDEEAQRAGREAVEMIRLRTSATGELGEQQKKTKKETEDLNNETKAFSEESRQMRTLLIGQGLDMAAQGLGQLAAGLKEASQELREVNPELAENAEQAAKVTNGLSAVASGAAAGMLTFGPIGAAVGATIGLLGQMARAWLDMEIDAAKANEKINDDLERMRDRLADVAIERARVANDKHREALEKDAESYRKVNVEVEKTIRLEKARRDANNAVADAKDRADLAAIDADESIPEAEKIKRRAEIRERGEARRTGEELQNLADRNRQADADAETKAMAARFANTASRDAEDDVANAEAEKQRLLGRVATRNDLQSAEAAAQRAQQEFETADRKETSAHRAIRGVISPFSDLGPSERDQAAARLQEALQNVENLRTSGNVATEAEVLDLKILEETIPGLKNTAADLKEKAAAAVEASNAEARNRDETKQLSAIERQGIVGAAPLDQQARATATASQVTRANERAAEEARRAEDRQRREEEQEARRVQAEERRVAGIGRQAEGRSETIAKSILKDMPRAAKAIEEAGDAVEADPSAETFDKLIKMLEIVKEKLKNDAKRQFEFGQGIEDLTRWRGEALRTNDIPHGNNR